MNIQRYTLLIAGLTIASSTWAHGGKVDANGCHNDNQTHQYHCHKGPHEGQTYNSKDAMLKGEGGAPMTSSAKKSTHPTEKVQTPATTSAESKTTKTETPTGKKADAASADSKDTNKDKHKKTKKAKTDKVQPAAQ